MNDRSKKALCTVTPSGSKITLKNFPSIISICAQRRIRPSFWITSFTGCSITYWIQASWIIARSGRLRNASKYRVHFTRHRLSADLFKREQIGQHRNAVFQIPTLHVRLGQPDRSQHRSLLPLPASASARNPNRNLLRGGRGVKQRICQKDVNDFEHLEASHLRDLRRERTGQAQINQAPRCQSYITLSRMLSRPPHPASKRLETWVSELHETNVLARFFLLYPLDS